jgi:hypothetical protein
MPEGINTLYRADKLLGLLSYVSQYSAVNVENVAVHKIRCAGGEKNSRAF